MKKVHVYEHFYELEVCKIPADCRHGVRNREEKGKAAWYYGRLHRDNPFSEKGTIRNDIVLSRGALQSNVLAQIATLILTALKQWAYWLLKVSFFIFGLHGKVVWALADIRNVARWLCEYQLLLFGRGWWLYHCNFSFSLNLASE